MKPILGRFPSETYALLRIIAGVMFLLHGTQKILGWPPMEQKMTFAVGTLPWFAGMIEIICGALILLGLFTSIAAFIASGEMAVAYFLGHAAKGGMNPLVNKGELAVLYCFVFLYIAANGSGIWSIDRVMSRGRAAT